MDEDRRSELGVNHKIEKRKAYGCNIPANSFYVMKKILDIQERTRYGIDEPYYKRYFIVNRRVHYMIIAYY